MLCRVRPAAHVTVTTLSALVHTHRRPGQQARGWPGAAPSRHKAPSDAHIRLEGAGAGAGAGAASLLGAGPGAAASRMGSEAACTQGRTRAGRRDAEARDASRAGRPRKAVIAAVGAGAAGLAAARAGACR